MKNLAVPKARGMTTVLVTGKPVEDDRRRPPQPTPENPPAAADFITNDLAEFLTRLNQLLPSCLV